jgi:hypothetical protein
VSGSDERRRDDEGRALGAEEALDRSVAEAGEAGKDIEDQAQPGDLTERTHGVDRPARDAG